MSPRLQIVDSPEIRLSQPKATRAEKIGKWFLLFILVEIFICMGHGLWLFQARIWGMLWGR